MYRVLNTLTFHTLLLLLLKAFSVSLSHSGTGEATLIYQFVTNNQASFHLCRNENLLNHKKLQNILNTIVEKPEP